MTHALSELREATAAIAATAEKMSKEEGDAAREHFEPYHNKQTRSGRKIHVPVNSFLEIGPDLAFVVTSISRKKIIIRGFGKALAVGQKMKLFDGNFIITTHKEEKDDKGRPTQVHALAPLPGTKINPHPLRK